MLSVSTYIHGEGILPPWTELEGIAMPSLSEALRRYPDSETKNGDGSTTEVFMNIYEKEYNAFNAYLNEQGAELGEHQLERGVLTAEILKDRVSCSFIYDIQNHEAKMVYSPGTYDPWIKTAKKKFTFAQWQLESGQTDGAFTEILGISQYRNYPPVKELLQHNSDLALAVEIYEKKIVPYQTIGSFVTFGRFEQDLKEENGPEAIEWIVIDYDANENKSLLLSRYCLEAVGYDHREGESGEGEPVDWETSQIRKQLNGTFMINAFTAVEQSAIMTTQVDNGPSQTCPEYHVKSGGNNTQDRVFLLSYAEASRYLGANVYNDNVKPRAAATAYALKTGAGIYNIRWWGSSQTADGEKSVQWWLRSPGDTPENAAFVTAYGRVNNEKNYVGEFMIRPALWLDLNSGIF